MDAALSFIAAAIRKNTGLSQENFSALIRSRQDRVSEAETQKRPYTDDEWLMIGDMFENNKLLQELAYMAADSIQFNKLLKYKNRRRVS